MTLQEIQREVARLVGLLDTEPGRAVVEARALMSGDEPLPKSIDVNKAAVFIEGGKLTRDREAVKEGIHLIEGLLADLSTTLDRPSLQYNLANGLLALSDLTPGFGSPGWNAQTEDARAKARVILTEVGWSDEAETSLRVQALTNLANTLSQSHRYVEAYDVYRFALELQPGFGMAALNAAVCLNHVIKRGLVGVYAQQRVDELIHLAAENRDDVVERGGGGAVQVLDRYISQFEDRRESIETTVLNHLTKEQAWVARHHLALAPGVESFRPELVRWDELLLPSYVESGVRSHHVPTVFAMFNAVKQSYILARTLAYGALEGETGSDTGQYADTLDYALWGSRPAKLLESQKMAIGVLDRVAVAVNHELATDVAAYRIHFHTFWNLAAVRPSIDAEIAAGNTALTAFRELATDLADAGALYQQRDIRNAATHRFVSLHDFPFEQHVRTSDEVARYRVDNFEDILIRSLQLARASLIYFTEFIAIRSTCLGSSGQGVRRIIPPHHTVRGEEDPL